MTVSQLLNQYGDRYLQALFATWRLTFFSFLGAFVIGIVITVLRVSPIKPLRLFGDFYVQIYRNIPGAALLILLVYALPYLNAMIHAAEDAGFTVYIAAGYRTYSYQTQMYNAKSSSIAWDKYQVTDYLDPNYQKAAEEAKKYVMYPGSSEHQLGLAVDIMDRQYKSLIYEYMDQDFFAWLDEHCADYGFIKRYPTRKLLLTGWDEPWHYRYVGVEAAKYIMEHGICYEEFYKHYMPDFKY